MLVLLFWGGCRLLLGDPRVNFFVPKGGGIRPWRCVVGDGTAQIGTFPVDELLVVVEIGRSRCLPLGVQSEEGTVQGLRSPAAGTHVVDEISVHIAHIQQVVSFVVGFDVLLEYLHGFTDVAFQQEAVAALHAGDVQP